ncbi:MAG: ABC transporter ATP-binding protein [Acidimicrobiales bacterium]
MLLPALRALPLPGRRVLLLAFFAFLSGLGSVATLVLLLNVGLRFTGATDATSVLGLDLVALSTGELFGGALFAAAVVFVVDLLAARQGARILAIVQLRLRTSLFDAYNEADWVTQTADPPGHLQDVVSTNVGQALILTTAINLGLVATLNLAAIVGVAAVINPLTTGVLIASLAALVAILSPLAGRLGTAAERMRAANHRYALGLAEITGVPTEIRTFGVDAAARERHRASADETATTLARLTWLEKAIPSGQRNLSLITVLAALAVLHRSGVASPEELGAVVVLLGRSITYVHALQQTVNRFASAGPFVFALEDEITRYGDDQTASASETTGAFTGAADVKLRGVEYRHPGADRRALHDIELDIEAGTYVALVGPSGSGKTTTAELVLGLRRPSAGTCTVGDSAPADLDPAVRAGVIAFVPQRPALIGGTLAENVRFLRDDIDDEEVIEALRGAGLTNADGEPLLALTTMLGGDGRMLSGGQLQRLAIARALAGGPRVLVLDEPTSALDPDAEAAISETLGRLAGTVTLIVIAHRPATIEGCDRVVVLDQGTIAADGPPATIAASSDFWQRGFVNAGARP